MARRHRATLGSGAHDELVPEQSREAPRDHRVDRVRRGDPALVPARRQHLIERRRRRGEALDHEPGVGDEVAERSEEHTSELQSRLHLVCRLLLEKKKKKNTTISTADATDDVTAAQILT